jgi:hypothetical protein
MDLTIISLVVTGVTTIITGLFTLLSRVQKCRSFCCSMTCMKRRNDVEDDHIPNDEQMFARVRPQRRITSPELD